jgi:hypothetical protein
MKPAHFDKEEYEFGKQAQSDCLPLLRKLDPSLEEIEDTFAPFDFTNQDKTLFIELKKRRNSKNAYPTTMIPYSKIRAILPNFRYIFAFQFTDGLYYIEYDYDLFKHFENRQGGRYDRGRPEIELYTFIPVNLLQPLQ